MKHIPVTLRLLGAAAASVALYACFGTESGAPTDDDLTKLASLPLGAGGNCATTVLISQWYNDDCSCNDALGSTTCALRYQAQHGLSGPSGVFTACGWNADNSPDECTNWGNLDCLPKCAGTQLSSGLCTDKTAFGDCWGYYESNGTLGRCGWYQNACYRLGKCGNF
jgi:hypothetical protein